MNTSRLQVTDDDIISTEGAFAAKSTSNHQHSSLHLLSNQGQQEKPLSADSLPVTRSSGSMKLLQRPAGQDGANGSASASGGAASSAEFGEQAVRSNAASGYGGDERGGGSPLDSMADSFRPVMMLLQKPPDESQAGNYASPLVNQTVKILRRPTQSNETRTSDLRPKQPIKSLKQREQEYAEARLRILGSAKNPEDEM